VLVNNAGVPLTRPAVVDVTEAEWNAVIDFNLKGVFFMSQQIASTARLSWSTAA
jgi:2-dehydro-3-deoxy-D-gluconate 5-dehydrogenase